MKADEALALAKFQRPGVKLIVGPTEAREVRFYRDMEEPMAVAAASQGGGLWARAWAALKKVFG